MHLVTKSYFANFCDEFAPPFGESKNFECFANFCVFSRHSADTVEPTDLVYEGADPGIDGAMVFLDDRAIFSSEELETIFASGQREYHVTFCFTQVKSSEGWKKNEIDTFFTAIVDLLSEEPAQPHSDYLAEMRRMFRVAFKNIGRIKGGLPDVIAYYCSAAPQTDAVEINASFAIGRSSLESLGYFREIDVVIAYRDILHEYWNGIDGGMEASLPTVSYAPFPAAPAISNAYVATVSARDFINCVLKSNEGAVRKKLFEENVRDFLGIDAEVNSEISNTLSDSDRKQRFGLMNNGVTIVASTVRPANQEIFIRDFQIVNGCQTSNMLIVHDDDIDQSVSLMVKMIEADDPAVIDDIVRATNRQSKVEDAQFISTLGFLRDLERFFDVRGQNEPNRLFFERRKGQYGPQNIAAIRVFDVRETARCYAATAMMRPDLASRYPNRLTSDLLNEVFKQGNTEEQYYVSCFAVYRIKILISNKRFDAKYSKLRWHILAAAYNYCEKNWRELGCSSLHDAFYQLFAANDGAWFDRLERIVLKALPDPDISRDLLKSPPLTNQMLSNVAGLGI